jgi:hypothetical protein
VRIGDYKEKRKGFWERENERSGEKEKREGDGKK